MFKNYLLTSWRNLRKNRVFSLINITGLAIGMAACLLILQYVNFELSYDQFNVKSADIYRVANDRYQNGKLIQHGTITYSAIGKAMQNDFPEVVNHARVEPWGGQVLSLHDKKIEVKKTIAVDNSMLSMFTFPFIEGDPKTALKEPYSIVLTQSTADRLLDGQKDYRQLIGMQLTMGKDSMPYKVTGICKDIPANSHLPFDILVSYNSMYSGRNAGYQAADYDFKDSDFWHYIQLRHGTDYKTLEAKFDAFSQRHFQGNKVSGSVEKFHLQPLAKAYLYSDYEYEIGETGSATVVWGLFIIALFIIVIAWVNYINLSTARSVERAKEVGIRKVSGATRAQLIRQFLVESLIVNLFSFILAVLLVTLVQDSFNSLVQVHLGFSNLFQKGLDGYSISIGLVVLILTGIFVSGFYPAFVLSSFIPAAVLKGKFSASNKGILLRKGLVIGQFAITILLITGSVVVYKQLMFLNKQELGMNMDQMLIVKPPKLTDWDSTFITKENSFKEDLKHIPGVVGAATADRVAGNEMGRVFNAHRSDDNSGNHFTMRSMGIDFNYINLYKIKLLAGRNFELRDYNAEFGKLHTIILNESAVKMLGFSSNAEALGKQIMIYDDKKWDVIGVIQDFHQKSLRYAVEPMDLLPLYSTYAHISVKVNTANVAATMAAIRGKYDQFFPGNIFEYYFLDERFNQQYANDKLFGKAFGLFAGLAIFIACLGLLGLSLFATMQRVKEIGVRKVLGATSTSIVYLLSKDFIRLVLLAFIIAAPLAWYIMHKWLEDFAYRISLNGWMFAVAGLLSMLIALMTIGFQAYRAAGANPVKSLRSE
jgi:putative ABC transport system permease protein